MAENSGDVQSIYFLPPDGAASCTVTESFKGLNLPIYIVVPNLYLTVMKGDCMGGASHKP